MARPHRFFIIAKPKGQRYRSLASTYHHWLDVTGALSTCHRLLQIFSDQVNSTAIQQELALAADFFGNAHNSEIRALSAPKRRGKPERTAPYPFPFIATCLIVGTSWDPDEGEYSPVLERFGLRCNKRGCDSMTILDITNLSDVRYCFMDFNGMVSRRNVLYTPLDGRTYSMAIYRDREVTHATVVRSKAVTDGLEKYALVESAALAECWPERDWQTNAAEFDFNAGLAHGETNKQAVPSLRSLCQAKLFQELLSSEDPPDPTLLDTPMLFSGFARDLQRFLTENVGALCESPAAVDILKKAFAGEKHFDFSLFHNKLASDDLVALASSDALRGINTAKLSGFDDETDVRTVVRIVEHLKLDSLYLLSRPDRPAEDQAKLITALATASSHPLVRQKLVLGSAFSRGIYSFRNLREDYPFTRPPAAVDLRYWKTFPVIQLLIWGPKDSGYTYPRLTGFLLGDAFLSPVRFVTGLLNVIKSRFRALYRFEDRAYVPLIFSCAPSSLKDLTIATEVSPLPMRAFARGPNSSKWSLSFEGNHPIQDLDPEGWTAVLVHYTTSDPETRGRMPSKTRFRVALVRSRDRPIPLTQGTITPNKLEVVDLMRFLELTATEHACDLEGCLSELTAWAETDGELVSKLPIDGVVTRLQAIMRTHMHRTYR